MSTDRRHLFAREALAQIPKILTLQDRNRHSPTYGCFDRNYWHYRIIDFPSGMAQEFVLPLALAYAIPAPDNPYFEAGEIKTWAQAGIRFAAASAHADGSCDDYFPFEKAAGAAAFSLLACLDAYRLLEFDDEAVLDFFRRRSDWLADHRESGRLANHQALIALCLELAGQVIRTDRWRDPAARRLRQVLSWQTDEGWFWEYEGCDPGYLTLTISVLARLHELHQSDDLRAALERAVRFAAHFVHPDGSFGGEYGSRNTYNFFPHGFELAGRWIPEALAVNDAYLSGLEAGLGPCFADDHIVGHHCWNMLLAWRDFQAERPARADSADGRRWFPGAGLLVERRGALALFAALNKGGVFKLFDGDKLISSDTQFSLRTGGRRRRNAVGHLIDDYTVDIGDHEITVAGDLGWAKQARMTPLKLIVLRLLMLTLGRFFPDLVRRLLQKMLIVGKTPAPYRFERRFSWRDGRLAVDDTLTAASWSGVESVALGVDQTSIYVVMSRTYQAGQLLGWLDLSDRLPSLRRGDSLTSSREYNSGSR